MSDFDFTWLKEKESSPTTILDVGCHDGTDSVRFNEAFPMARIIGIEADPKNYQKALERKSKVEFYNYAIRNYVGETGFYPSATYKRKKSWSYSGSVFESNPKKNSRLTFHEQIKIPCITLSTFCLERNIEKIDLLHMDVQGAEKEVIESLESLRPTLIFAEISEFNKYKTNTSKEEFEETLIRIGYQIKKRLSYDVLFELHSKNKD